MTELRAVTLIARVLERTGVISQERFRPTFDLAWPRVVTGFSIMSKQTADLAMIGIAIGTAGTAGMAYALAYWQVVLMFGLGLAGGTISLVSQNFGGDRHHRATLAIKLSIIVGIVVSLPIMAIFWQYPDVLIGVFGGDSASAHHGITYLVFVTPAVLLETLNLIASRTYTGVGDTFTEMMIRSGGAVFNVVLSAILIFGFTLGVAGAAIGTTISTALVTVVLAWGMFGRSYGRLGMEPNPVAISWGRPWFDAEMFLQLIEISIPEIGRKVAEGIIVFPLLWVAAIFGPVVVTGLEVGRRVRGLINSVNWGLSLASSSLVGNHLGDHDEAEAGEYGAAIIRLSVVIFIGLAAVTIVFATPIARVFVSGDAAVAQTATFVIIAAISAVGFGLDGAATGALVGAGDTRLPFVAALVGRYLLALPVALLAVVTPLGVVALYLAMLVETFVPGGINYALFRTGRWKKISRRYRPDAG